MSKELASSRRGFAAVLLILVGCPGETSDGGQDTDGACSDTDGVPPAGEWDPEVVDWSDVAEPGFEGDALSPGVCGTNNTTAHHCFLTAVHAVHLPTGQLLMFHGQQDERLWDIGSPAETMTWHPAGPQTSWERRELASEANEGSDCLPGEDWCWEPWNGLPQTFCSGHTQLANGEVFVAGGNVTGRATGGGLADTWTFDANSPWAVPATALGCGFGWNGQGGQEPMPRMEYDRWYPTLTILGDGRVLIAGGTSREAAKELYPGDHNGGVAIQPPMLELYNPTSSTIGITGPGELVTITSAPFPVENGDGDPLGVPNYPFMFLLPNGDVFYAGSENAGNQTQDGRILIPDTNSATGAWEWDSHIVSSTIPGGSAVMYKPGKILKTGGGGTPSATAEWVDLSGFAPGDYDAAPTAFTRAGQGDPQGPEFARHFHNLVLLPDGRVVSVGGNDRGNGGSGEHHANPCDVNGQDMEEYDCVTDGCPTVCIDQRPIVTSNCMPADEPDYGCSLLHGIQCDCARAGDSNSCSNLPNCTWDGDSCELVMDSDQFCDAALSGATCGYDRSGRSYCDKPCAGADEEPDNSMCGPLSTVGGQCVSQTDGNACRPQNNGCDATKTLEMWDPSCQAWTTLGEQDRPRMYHSTALLIPDGRVISMGGGHVDFGWLEVPEQPNAEYFEPQYTSAASASRPEVTVPAEMTYNQEVSVVVENDIPLARATLVRLGSTTHGFDMSQRFIELPAPMGTGSQYTVMAPADVELGGGVTHRAENIAPPGHYMLFLFSDQGMPSVGAYVKVGPPTLGELNCVSSPKLHVDETSCSMEPVGGACPSEGEVVRTLAVPTVDAAAGTFKGFQVYASSSVMHDIDDPRPYELGAVQGLCQEACDAYFADVPGASANCDVSGGFELKLEGEGDPALSLVPSKDREGTGVFPGVSPGCDLGTTCDQAFDEMLARAVPKRTTPAGESLGYGVERLLALGRGSAVTLQTNLGKYSIGLSGEIGYSECADRNGASDCPFYLGLLEASTSREVTLAAKCKDGEKARVTLDNLVIRLSQPAFGVSEGGSDAVGFPPGALVVDTAFDVGRDHARVKRPNREAVVLSAGGGRFSSDGLVVGFELPCGQSTADVVATLDLVDPGDGSQLAHAPVVKIDVPDIVTCGTSVALAAKVTDRDNDIESTRWFVDGVLMEEGLASVPVSQGHELEVVARDSRGAATTAKKAIECN